VEPLEGIRKDWPVAIIPDSGHINCVARPAFKNDIREWIEQHQTVKR
jgi:hypothetical protein